MRVGDRVFYLAATIEDWMAPADYDWGLFVAGPELRFPAAAPPVAGCSTEQR